LPFATLCYATNALEFANGSGLGSNLTYPVMIDHVFGPTTGHLRIDLTSGEAGGSESNHVLTSGNGLALRGLPAIGFLAVDYINANSTPGVLANYSGVYRHKSTVACSSSANAPATCP